jgi:hypothetical protein
MFPLGFTLVPLAWGMVCRLGWHLAVLCAAKMDRRVNTPPKGTYEIIVQNYSQSKDVAVPFTVSITKDGETELIEKIMPSNGPFEGFSPLMKMMSGKKEVKVKTLKY